MRATIMHGAGDMRVITVPDAALQRPGRRGGAGAAGPASAAATCTLTTRCLPSRDGKPMGQEFLGVVEELGTEVSTLQRGDVVIGPFAWSDNTCDFCREGLRTSCRHGGFWGGNGTGGDFHSRSSSTREPRRPWPLPARRCWRTPRGPAHPCPPRTGRPAPTPRPPRPMGAPQPRSTARTQRPQPRPARAPRPRSTMPERRSRSTSWCALHRVCAGRCRGPGRGRCRRTPSRWHRQRSPHRWDRRPCR